MDTDSDTPGLVERAVQGETAALMLLLTSSHRWLCDHISRRVPAALRSTIDAEDIVQEAHIEAFRRIGQFKPRGRGSFDRWILTVALTRLRNAIRRHRAAKRGGAVAVRPGDERLDDSTYALWNKLAGPRHTPSRSVARREAIQAVRRAIEELPERYRQVVWMMHIRGETVREVAQQIGRTERAVHGLSRRGLKLLAQRLQPGGEFLSSS